MNIKQCTAALCVAAVVSISGAVTAPVWATNDSSRVCAGQHLAPDDGKNDEATETYAAPAGFLISSYCVKAGSDNQKDGGPEYVSVTPPAATITISHSTGKDVSHFSVTLVPVLVPVLVPPVPVPPVPAPPVPAPPVVPPVAPPVAAPVEVAPAQANAGGGSNNNSGGDVEVQGEQASAGSDVKGQAQQNQNPAAGTTVAGQQQAAPSAAVPTSINAGTSADAAGTQLMVPASLAMLGALLGLLAFAARRRA